MLQWAAHYTQPALSASGLSSSQRGSCCGCSAPCHISNPQEMKTLRDFSWNEPCLWNTTVYIQLKTKGKIRIWQEEETKKQRQQDEGRQVGRQAEREGGRERTVENAGSRLCTNCNSNVYSHTEIDTGRRLPKESTFRLRKFWKEFLQNYLAVAVETSKSHRKTSKTCGVQVSSLYPTSKKHIIPSVDCSKTDRSLSSGFELHWVSASPASVPRGCTVPPR